MSYSVKLLSGINYVMYIEFPHRTLVFPSGNLPRSTAHALGNAGQVEEDISSLYGHPIHSMKFRLNLSRTDIKSLERAFAVTSTWKNLPETQISMELINKLK